MNSAVFDKDAYRRKWADRVLSWDEEHLQAAAWKASQTDSNAVYIDVLMAEFARRGLTPVHGYFGARCALCSKKALYRLKGLTFCRDHREIAAAGRRHYSRVLDREAQEREVAVEERERFQRRLDHLAALHKSVGPKAVR